MNSDTFSETTPGVKAPATQPQNADGASFGSRGPNATSKPRAHRGKRAGVALRAKKETERASRESPWDKHISREARSGNIGMINYKATDQTRLLQLVDELVNIAEEKTERELFPIKEADVRTYTDDWSNVHLWNAAIAHYVYMTSKVPNLYKQIDIIEYLSYVQMVVELRLMRQRNIPSDHPLRATDVYDLPDPILLQSVLPVEIVNFMEKLRPTYGKEGGLLYFLPYQYVYSYSQDAAMESWTQSKVIDKTFVYHDRDIPAQRNGRNQREGYHQITRIDFKRSRVVDALMRDVGTRFKTLRLNIFSLIQLRNYSLQHNKREISSIEMNRVLGWPLFTGSFQLNVNRQMSIQDGTTPHYGSLLSGETVLYTVLTRVFNQMSLNYFTGFDVEVWRPTIRPITIEKAVEEGGLQFFQTSKPSDYIATPFVIKPTVTDEDGLKILDEIRHRGLLGPSRWKSYLTTTIQALQMYYEAHIGGQSMASLIKEWHDSSALG